MSMRLEKAPKLVTYWFDEDVLQVEEFDLRSAVPSGPQSLASVSLGILRILAVRVLPAAGPLARRGLVRVGGVLAARRGGAAAANSLKERYDLRQGRLTPTKI